MAAAAPKVDITIHGDVRVVKPAIGDKIVVTMDARLQRDHLVAVREHLQALWPRNEVIILAGAYSIGLLSPGNHKPTPVI